jgi:hypothetical protein
MCKSAPVAASRTGWAAANRTIGASSDAPVASGYERTLRPSTRTVFARHPARLSATVTDV